MTCPWRDLPSVNYLTPFKKTTCAIGHFTRSRMQDISDLAGCPWLRTKYKHFEESPLFKSTVFGHCYAWESEDFYTGPSQQSPRRSALIQSNTFQGSPLFKFDCRWEWHAMAVQRHPKLSNWDASKEPWLLCPPFSTFQKATFATGNFTRRSQQHANLPEWKASLILLAALWCKRNLNTFKEVFFSIWL